MPAKAKSVSFAPKVKGFQESPAVVNSGKGFYHLFHCHKCEAHLKSLGRGLSQRGVKTDSQEPPKDVHCRLLMPNGKPCEGKMVHVLTQPRRVTPIA